MRPTLSKFEEQFAELYAEGATAAEALISLGIAPERAESLGAQMLGNRMIRDRVDVILLRKRVTKENIRAEFIDRYLFPFHKLFVNGEDGGTFDFSWLSAREVGFLAPIKVRIYRSGRISTRVRHPRYIAGLQAVVMRMLRAYQEGIPGSPMAEEKRRKEEARKRRFAPRDPVARG